MLWRYAGEPAVSGTLASFKDADALSDWAVPVMRWACSTGLISGINGVLAPQQIATRAQAAAMLYRFCGRCVKQEHKNSRS